MPLVSITRLRIRSWRFLPIFLYRTLRSANQAKAANGNMAASLLNDKHWTFWTCTLWNAEADMKAFMISGAHGKAMRRLLEWCDEAALVHWMQDDGEVPDWQDAHRRLLESGRPSKVNHPSADHLAFRFPSPVVSRNRGARLK